MKRLAINDLTSVLGLPCWQVRWDNQVGLDMNFGPPTMTIDEPRASTARSPRVRAMFARRRVFLHGTHRLFADPFTWRIRLSDGFSASSSSSARRKKIACHRLSGEKLQAIVIDCRSGRTEFLFDLGASVRIRGSRETPTEDSDRWSLHARKRGRFVAVHAGGAYRSGSVRGTGDGVHPFQLTEGAAKLVIGKVANAFR